MINKASTISMSKNLRVGVYMASHLKSNIHTFSIPFCEEFYYCQAGAKGGRAPPNILGFPFCLLKKYEPKENLLIGCPWNYFFYGETIHN
jgi:hypothetical protein